MWDDGFSVVGFAQEWGAGGTLLSLPQKFSGGAQSVSKSLGKRAECSAHPSPAPCPIHARNATAFLTGPQNHRLHLTSLVSLDDPLLSRRWSSALCGHDLDLQQTPQSQGAFPAPSLSICMGTCKVVT